MGCARGGGKQGGIGGAADADAALASRAIPVGAAPNASTSAGGLGPSLGPSLGFSWGARIARGAALTDRTVAAAQEVLAGRRRGIVAYLAFAGPAVVASIAYMDPGNFATNIQAGAKYGYGLLWVVLLANLIAMLFQALSAKLGIVTGRNLAGNVPRAISAAGGLGDVGGQRDRRDGDRSCRVSRRRHRAVAAVPHAAAGRHGRHRRRRPMAS